MDGDDGGALITMSFGHDLESSSKRRRLGSSSDEIIENIANDGDVGIWEEIITGEMVFKSLYMVSAWKEPGSMTNCAYVAVGLPSGVGRVDFPFRVVDEGSFLEVRVTWPAALTNVLSIHRNWPANKVQAGLGPIIRSF